MPIILKKHHAKYKVNTTLDKGVTKLMSPLPTMSPFSADVANAHGENVSGDPVLRITSPMR